MGKTVHQITVSNINNSIMYKRFYIVYKPLCINVFLNIKYQTNRSSYKLIIFTDFQLNVLMKLDKIIAKQEESSLLLRRLLQTRGRHRAREPYPIGQLPDLLSFEDKLRGDEELQRKTVKNLTFLFEAELNCMHRI